jgi:hypothetical protein
MNDTEPKPRLPLLLRLAFVLTVCSIITVNLAVRWPPWEEDTSDQPLLTQSLLEPAAHLAWQMEQDAIDAKTPRIGWLTYAKRNYKRWIRKYMQNKFKKKLEKYLKQSGNEPQKQKQ